MFYSAVVAKRKSTIALIWRTKPFITARLAVYAVFFFATIGFVGTVFFLLKLFASQWVIQLVLILGSVGGYLLGRNYLRRYLTYVGQAPHIMGMVDVLKGTQLEKGDRLVDVSTRRVETQFDEMSRLYKVEGLTNKVLIETRSDLVGNEAFKPLPAFDRLGKLSSWMLRWALSYVRDGILGYVFYKGDTNVWKVARGGILRYETQKTKLAKTAVRLQFLGVVFGSVLFALLLIPALRLLGQAENPEFLAQVVVFGGLAKAAWVVKAAMYEPVALAFLLPRIIEKFEETTVDKETREALEERSKRFRELSLRARNHSDGDGDEAPKKLTAKTTEKAEDKASKGPRKSLAKRRNVSKSSKPESKPKKKATSEEPDEETDPSAILDALGDLPDELEDDDPDCSQS